MFFMMNQIVLIKKFYVYKVFIDLFNFLNAFNFVIANVIHPRTHHFSKHAFDVAWCSFGESIVCGKGAGPANARAYEHVPLDLFCMRC